MLRRSGGTWFVGNGNKISLPLSPKMDTRTLFASSSLLLVEGTGGKTDENEKGKEDEDRRKDKRGDKTLPLGLETFRGDNNNGLFYLSRTIEWQQFAHRHSST